MARVKFTVIFALLVFFTNLLSISAFTVPSEVLALESLYASLFTPKQLNGWRLDGGDPCGSESWRGVTCSGPGIVSVNISGLGVHGNLDSANLAGFMSLKELDLSNNNIIGSVPAIMPPNATHIDLSRNNLIKTLPYPLPTWKHLKYLNISHNMLHGPIGDVFSDMQNLEKLDFSFNNFLGDLPSSISMLPNIHELHLENNHFTGSVSFLANLPLHVLHIEHNFFSGLVPKQFESIPELGMDDNCFGSDDACFRSDEGPSPPVPSPTVPSPVVIVIPFPFGDHPSIDQSSPSPSFAQNISPSPSPEVGGVSLQERRSNHKRLGTGAIAGIVCSVVLAVVLIVAAAVVYIRRQS